MGMLQPFQDCGAIIREIAGRVKRILDMPAMFVWYFKEEKPAYPCAGGFQPGFERSHWEPQRIADNP